MSVHKDKRSNTWYVKCQNRTKRGFRYKKEAIEYEASLMVNPGKSEMVKFKDFADEYMRFKKNEVQYTTWIKYKECIDIVMKPHFPNKPIDEITIHDCDEFKAKLGKLDYSTSYKNKLMTQMKGMFNYAIRRKLIKENPAGLLTAFRKTASDIEDMKAREENIWTYEDFQKFIVCLEGKPYQALFYTLFNTGIRLGEALALCWTDLKDSQLSITKAHTKQTEQGGYEIKTPKSSSSIRVVSINKSLNDYLLEYKQECMEKDKLFSENDYIFGGKKPLARTSIETKKNKAVAASGVRKIRIHDLRHSHATILINNGMNIVAVSKRLGHSDINMTLKIYTHLLDKNDSEILDFLEKTSHNSSQNSLKKEVEIKKTA